jgi:uncharacterized protein (TIGR02145 family)
LAPIGWHVPTDDEWTILENYLITFGFNYDGTATGDRSSNNKIGKALASTTGWNSDGGTGTVGNTDYPTKRNATGFTALPGGFNDGTFRYIGIYGYWWSSSDCSTNRAYYRCLYSGGSGVGRDCLMSMGISVRCVKD